MMGAPKGGADWLGGLCAPSPALYSIPAGRPFLRDLATPLIAAYKDDPAAIADVTIFLPNRRAVRSLSMIFHEAASKGGAVFLPRLRALGDVDEEDLLFSGRAPSAALDLPPAADRQERRLILATLVHRQRAGADDWPACLDAADALGRLLDEFHTDDISLSALEDLVPADVVEGAAGHWQQSLEFLTIISAAWPQIMAGLGWMEPAARLRQLMGALADSLAVQADQKPVIVAGSLGTVRATGALMAAVAQAPRGLVVLPGVDLDLDAEAWAKVDPPHPQGVFHDRFTRDFGDLDRAAVQPWPSAGGVDDPAAGARRAFLSLALRPASATDDWYTRFASFQAAGTLTQACDGLGIAIADSENEEASFISVLIREALAVPDKTVMLVTPDRDLARRVAAKLLAWGLEVDDSGGVPLAGTFRGTFLRNIAQWLDDPADPMALLAMLKHELAAMGQERNRFGDIIRTLDYALRGVRLGDDLAGVRLAIEAKRLPSWAEPHRDGVLALLDGLANQAAAFRAAPTLRDRIILHLRFAEQVAATDEETGAARLWRFEDGEPLATGLAGVVRSAFLPDGGAPGAYAPLFEALLAGGMARKRGGHPRLSIFGLLEARLQSADVTILGGLNEGVWPDAAATDPFLSRPMRASLGLASPEQMIGRAAHDFAQAASSPQVILTRSARRGRSPATPSRWLVRLESFLHKAKIFQSVDVAPRLRALLAARHVPTHMDSVSAPAPTPPVAARPRRLSITDMERLLRDPYAIYAKHVLRLSPWRAVEEPLGPRERGEILHAVTEEFTGAYPDGLPADTPAAFAAVLDRVLADHQLPAHVQTIWAADFARAVQRLTAFETMARGEGRPKISEGAAEWLLALPGGDFHLTARADRIDRLHDGTASIIDFKTSDRCPTAKQIKAFSPQLLLTALMVQGGAFERLGELTVQRVAYVNMLDKSGKGPFHKDNMVEGEELADAIKEAQEALIALLAAYDDPNQPYLSQPRAFFQNDYGDYDHLARRAEWAGDAGDGPDD